MFKRTLIVLEPRVHLEAIVMRCIAIARACAGEVFFYTGLKRERWPAADLAAPETAARWNALDDARLEAERLHLHAGQLAQGSGVPSRSVISVISDPVQDILSAAGSHHCDVIVVVSDGDSALARLFNGSSIPGLITASPVPILVCPAATAAQQPEDVRMNRLLVQLEHRAEDGAASMAGLELAREVGAEVLFFHVTPSSWQAVADPVGCVGPLADRLSETIHTQSQRLLGSANALAERDGLIARGLNLQAGTTAEDVARIAVQEACNLIVVAHHGGNAVLRLLKGSLIPGLISASTTPVLICRESEQLRPN